ncbi:MAG: cell division protein FtsZ [Alphaproteobacteria bacterium]|nr:cell division protein FtsZ [Alphaproteobacteria bacterium]MBQ9235847.1 cell division protein FtsZ [Alphaproteobacteria bacterium]
MSIKLAVPEKNVVQLKPRISVIGVGGGGGNAVNNMIEKKLEGIDFIVANTDAQALENSKTQRRIQLGLTTTKGLGAGARPEIGKIAAEEALDDIKRELEGANMVFITAGMGGGTGSGAAPVVAKVAKEQGILTVGVVTKPFQFEGKKRSMTAETALENFTKEVDSIIVIPNQNLFRIANKDTTLLDAFVMADNVLYDGVRSITDLMMKPGLINLDFADVKAIMEDQGKAIMGTGEAEGEDRAIKAAEQALSNPLLDDCSMKGAKGVLINITASQDVTIMEINDAVNRIKDEVDEEANIIFGSSFDDTLEGKIRVSIVATGIDENQKATYAPRFETKREEAKPVSVPEEEPVNHTAATKPQEEERGKSEDIAQVLKQISGELDDASGSEMEEKAEVVPLHADEPEVLPVEDEAAKVQDFDNVVKSDVVEDMPNATALFKAIIEQNEPPAEQIKEEKPVIVEAAVRRDEDIFVPKTALRMPKEEPELFPNHNAAPISVKPKEEPEELIVNEPEKRRRSFIEIMTGRSIAKRNQQKQTVRTQEPVMSLSNDDEDKVNLEIPSFLRRK